MTPDKSIYWMRKLLRNESNIGIVGQLSPPRIGWTAFSVFLEWRHFRPSTSDADQLQVFTLPWEDIMWSVLIFPQAKVEIADDLMRQLGLRRANGIPTMFPGPKFFPVQAPNLWTAENIDGHFVYRNNRATGVTAEEAERTAINQELARWGRPPRYPNR